MTTTLSRRAQAISPSETLKISSKAKSLVREGRSIISLSAGEPDFNTPEHICKAGSQAIENGFHGYTMNTGTPELREAIVDKLQRDNGLDYHSDQIVASNGAKQSLALSMLALVDEGEEVIIPAPYWVSYPQMAKLAGGKPVTIRTSFENNYKLTPTQLEEALNEKTKVLVLCSPSNPTGACYSRSELAALGQVLQNYPDVVIISDEIYEYIVFDDEHAGILQADHSLKERTIVINGFSKGFAMTGWRLGYLAAPSSIADAVAKLQSQMTSAPSAISQKAGEAAYREGLDAVHNMREQFRQRRDYVVETLNNIEGISCFWPSGAFYVFPDISAYLDRTTDNGETIENSTDLCLYLLEEHGLAAVPGDAFGEPNGIRLSYASSLEDLQEGLRRLKQGLGQLQK